MPYNHTTLGDAKTQLAALLGDPGKVFWTDTELGVHIVEALRTFGSMSLYWRERGAFASVAGTAFYALETQLSALLGYTVTDTDLVGAIQYHFLEPSTGSSWTGTDMFALSDLQTALQRRRNKFLVETGAVITHSTQIIVPGPLGRFALSDSVIDVRRVSFQENLSTTWATLWREDEFSITAANPSWVQNPGAPSGYSVVAVPPLTLQLAPPPLAAGTLDLLTVNAGAALDPVATVILGVPDDFAWVVKFGAMADLLGKDGQARDPERAAYCEERWKDGIALARIYTSIMQLQINDVPVYTCSVQELDSGDRNWQGSNGTPFVGALAGLNVLALANVPDAAYGISADVVRKAPVPAVDGDQIQIGREELDAILRYAEHLAAFKMGGAEFMATKIHYQALMGAAMVYNERLRANARYFSVLTDRATEEKRRRKRREPIEA